MSLSKIALNLDITDQTGKGNKDIVRAYGKKVFEIMENTLVVKIPYNESVVNVPNDGTQNVAQNVAQNDTPNDTQKSIEDLIIEYILNDKHITKEELANKIGKSKATITRTIRASDKIMYFGSSKGGYWKIKD